MSCSMVTIIASRRCSAVRAITRWTRSPQRRTLAIYCQGRPGSAEEVFSYTNGHFLVNQEYEFAKRYARFNIDGLCKVVESVTSIASPVAKIDKKEGGYNKALLMTTENGKKAVGKIPCLKIVPPKYGTASEVAVLKFVLAWSADASNPVQSEYMVLEQTTGQQLTGVWDSLEEPERLRLIQGFAHLESKLASIKFPAYGALYLREHLPPRLKQTGRIIDVDETYCLGPVYHGSWPGGYEANLEDYEQYSGPWRSLSELGSDLAQQGIWQIENHKTAYPGRPPHFGPPEEHVSMLRTTIKLMHVLSKSPKLQQYSQPALCHPDFHPGNIFVSHDDPTKISGVIDWQFTVVMPRFTQVRWPVFLNTPEGYQTNKETADLPTDAENEVGWSKERTTEKQKRDQDRRAKCYEAAVVKTHPESYLALTEIDSAVRELFISCPYTYRDGILPVRNYLIKIFQNWSQFQLSEDCPYKFSQEEIAQHQKQFDEYKDWIEMRQRTQEMLGCNDGGWVPPGVDFEEAKRKHSKLYEDFVRCKMKYNNMPESEARKLWLFRERG